MQRTLSYGGTGATAIVCTVLATALLVAIAAPEQAAAYSISGQVIAYASPDGGTINRSDSAGAATLLADGGISIGSGGAYAESAYFANLATGLLGTYVYGDSPNAARYGGGGAHVESRVTFSDMLIFTVPAGTYASDLRVSLRGFVNGTLMASGCNGPGAGARCSNVYETYSFSIGSALGGDTFSADSGDTHTYPGNSPNVISENFTLTATILRAGNYASEQHPSLSVTASLTGKGAALSLYPSTGDTASAVRGDFLSTGGYRSVLVPADVSWVSDSGVFLAFVPIPPAIVLLGTAVAGLAAVRLCHGRHMRS